MIIALTFLIVAIISGILGFGIIAGPVGWIAIGFFVCFMMLFLATLVREKRAT